MWKIAVILLLAAFCVHADEEPQQQPSKNGPSLVHTALCYISPTPWDCVKEQAGRALNYWEQTVDDKRHELMVEADEEMKKSETTRNLSDDEKKENPSEVIGAVEKGIREIADSMRDEIFGVSDRESRAMSKQIDDVNDFNDDYSIIDAFSKAEGKLSEARAKKGETKQNPSSGANGGFDSFGDDGFGYSGYGYSGGKGKKGKKGKKGVMKMFFLGAIIKSKVELLLRILSFHLQVKFFAVALASLVINLARFWVDLKKAPQKVVYVEHAQHQHHYDEHDDWGNSWKRQGANNNNNNNQDYNQDNFAHRLAYNPSFYPQQQN